MSLQEYLDKEVADGTVSRQIPVIALAWVSLLKALVPDLPEPDCSAGPEGRIMCVWHKGPHHFELEVHSDGSEFFYRNHDTGLIWGDDAIPAKALVFLGDMT